MRVHRVAAPTVTVRLRVRVPPGSGAVHVSGDAPELGGWRPDGVPLRRLGPRLYAGELALARGTTIRFKFTQGSWATVERDADDEEVPDREHRADEPAELDLEVKRWATPPAHTLTGDIRFHPKFESSHLGNRRTLAVYLPPGYGGGEERFPVLYLNDGQNVFDRATAAFGVEWEADETAERLVRNGRVRPVILVAVYNNAERSREYTAPLGQPTGQADDYARFLAEEVKPFVDRTYRTRPGPADTGVAGSSLGGTVSLYACARHPGTFGLCAAFSPAVGWQGAPFLAELRARLATERLWVSCGTHEGKNRRRYLAAARKLVGILSARGLAHRYLEVKGGEHTEAAWAAQFEPMLTYLFPPEEDAARTDGPPDA